VKARRGRGIFVYREETFGGMAAIVDAGCRKQARLYYCSNRLFSRGFPAVASLPNPPVFY
jgi:hypothetical protein